MIARLRERCFRASSVLVSFETARTAALDMVRPHGRIEHVPIAAAAGRVLARDLAAPHALPPFDQAAMDGYALRFPDRENIRPNLPITGRTEAGDPPGLLLPGTAHSVMTGGILPQGADTVVMLEQAVRRGDSIDIAPGSARGSHIRRAGEDVPAGSLALEQGRHIRWPEIALLAAFGIESVPVAEPVRIAVLVTGSELRGPGKPLPAGSIHDSNGPMLAALLRESGMDISVQRVDDDGAAIAAELARLAGKADIVVTTAGMSVGARDHVPDAVMAIGGQLDIFKIAMKPGKPLALGRIGGAVYVGLPGNPQAVACGALAFLRPMIDAMLGCPAKAPFMAEAAFARGIRSADRTELLPVRLCNRNGRLVAERVGPEGSHRLAPIAAADAMAIIPAPRPLDPGTLVEILPFARMLPKGD
ncbi:Molybdopterin molybdenumtransferase [Hyphomicrobiales bacterium]|nr:Molybdopterin molybdenumtransferase [Hyphomicrobiales bacterium]CAH1691681.1 Molybdopterin molybdenumtransferase [Hyphomicrobiales bacterium]